MSSKQELLEAFKVLDKFHIDSNIHNFLCKDYKWFYNGTILRVFNDDSIQENSYSLARYVDYVLFSKCPLYQFEINNEYRLHWNRYEDNEVMTLISKSNKVLVLSKENKIEFDFPSIISKLIEAQKEFAKVDNFYAISWVQNVIEHIKENYIPKTSY